MTPLPSGGYLQDVAARAHALLADLAAPITVIEFRGARHLWPGCPYGGDDPEGLVPGAGLDHQVSAYELFSIDDCRTCAAQLLPGRPVHRWLSGQLDPVAALDAADPGGALARVVPTRIVGEAAVGLLLEKVVRTWRLVPALSAPVTVVSRCAEVQDRLAAGVHSPCGGSVVPARAGELTLAGSAPDSSASLHVTPRYLADVAEVFFRVRAESSDDGSAWALAEAVVSPARRR